VEKLVLASSFPFEEKLGSHFWSEKDLFFFKFLNLKKKRKKVWGRVF
jgi:hypothetical protein